MARSTTINYKNDIWFGYRGCTHHMPGERKGSTELNEAKKAIFFGDNKEIQVGGEGTIYVKTSQGKVELIQNVLFALSLAQNLLSVEQLLSCIFSVLFDDYSCVIKNKKAGQILPNIHMI